MLSSSPARWVVLDLRGLDFMDSTGLRILIQIDARARNDEFRFVILCGDGHVRHVLRESGLDGVLPLVDGTGAVPASDSPSRPSAVSGCGSSMKTSTAMSGSMLLSLMKAITLRSDNRSTAATRSSRIAH